MRNNKYDEAYLRSHDIDWFCIIGETCCHIASAGGLIPDAINDREKLRNMQKRVFDSDYIFGKDEIGINEEFLIERFGDDSGRAVDDYLETFIDMARKGFVSLDRTNFAIPESLDETSSSEPTGWEYHIVCYPKGTKKDEELPKIQDFRSRFSNLHRVGGNIKERIRKNELTNIRLFDYFK